MIKNTKNNPNDIENLDICESRKLLARLRQDQLEAALAGRMDESAFYAGEARALREELEESAGIESDCACV